MIRISKLKYNGNYNKIFDYIKSHGSITRAEVQEILIVGKTKAYELLSEMIEEGLLIKEGSSNKIYYIMKN